MHRGGGWKMHTKRCKVDKLFDLGFGLGQERPVVQLLPHDEDCTAYGAQRLTARHSRRGVGHLVE